MVGRGFNPAVKDAFSFSASGVFANSASRVFCGKPLKPSFGRIAHERKNLSPQIRAAATDALFAAIDRDREYWRNDLDKFDLELATLGRAAEKQRELCLAQPKKFSPDELEFGRDDNARRICIQSKQWAEFRMRYGEYVATMRNLLALKRESIDPMKLKIEDLVPKDSMGRRNSIHELQNYVVGLSKHGLVLNKDGSLDLDRSFIRLNYFDLLHEQAVRNNVQPAVSNRPVDFIATRIPLASIAPALSEDLKADNDPVWLYAGKDRQALIIPRGEFAGQLQLRYLPVANLTQDAKGSIHFDRADWKSGFPLKRS